MNRRDAISALCALGAARALAVRAQAAEKIRRIGFFYYGSRQSAIQTGRYEAFLRGMADLGYVEGKDFVVEARYADGKVGRLPELAADLVRSRVDVMVATGGPAIRAAQRAANAIPIVFTVTLDPVREGFAASLARPGGNITGITSMSHDLFPKQIELLAAFIPDLKRVGVLLKPDNPAHPQMLKLLIAAGAKAGVHILAIHARTPDEIESAFAGMRRDLVQAVVVLGETFFVQQSRQIASLARSYAFPSVYLDRIYPEAGGLASYGPSIIDSTHRAAHYVDRILKGAKPGDLPIEQPTRLYLVINRAAVREIGLAIPKEVLVRADEVIE